MRHALGPAGGHHDFHQTERFVVVDEGEPQQHAAWNGLAVGAAAEPLGPGGREVARRRLVPRRNDGMVGHTVRVAQPHPSAAQPEAAAQRTRGCRERILRSEADRQNPGHLGQDTQPRMIGIECGGGHWPLT